MTTDPASPHDEYARRLALAREVEADLNRRDARIANARLLLFLIALPLAWGAIGAGWFSPWWLILPAVLFVVLIRVHIRAARAHTRARKAIAIYDRGLARLEDRWIGIGHDGARFLDPAHPYAADLDLFGKGSLFQRISTARTREGETVLASWLLTPSYPDTIRSRQVAIADLRTRIDLREDLAELGEGRAEALHAEALSLWGQEREDVPLGPSRLLSPILGAVGTTAILGWFFFGLDGRATLTLLAVEAAFGFWMRKPRGRILGHVSRRAEDLAMVAATLARIERETFEAPHLVELQSRLIAGRVAASARIERLYRTVDLLEWRRNLLFAPIALLWLWDTQVALAIESWRRRSGPEVAGWMAAVGEFEALASLSAYAFENPDDPFAEIAIEGDPLMAATRLGHPLLPKAVCVRNDVAIGGELRVLIVSGSNMSGKSTLMRTVGVNVVLALAGGPVKAGTMRVSPVSLGATLRIQDSLQEGKSRFYAEILRLKQVVELTRGARPVLFLLDEILHGTNSHDRLQGASAIVRGLIDRGAIGLVTTHDLALAEVAETLAPRAANVHFEDHFEDGVMRFDYTMRPGVVRNSNALALMRAVGLDV